VSRVLYISKGKSYLSKDDGHEVLVLNVKAQVMEIADGSIRTTALVEYVRCGSKEGALGVSSLHGTEFAYKYRERE